MLVAIQFPLADCRAFLSADTGRLPIAGWTGVRLGRDFIRGAGVIRSRLLGGIEEWASEELACQAHGTLAFCGTRPLSTLVETSRRTASCAFRRFLSNGVAVSRFEIGIADTRTPDNRPIARYDLGLLLDRVARLRVRVPARSVDPCDLLQATGRLSTHFLTSTTKRLNGVRAATQNWWLEAGNPVVIVEHWTDEVSRSPRATKQVLELEAAGVRVSHAWFTHAGIRVGCWMLERSLATDRDVIRRMRLHLLRLHAERECLRLVLRRVGSAQIPIVRETDASEALQRYLNETLALFSREDRDGLPQSELLKVASRAGDVVAPGERATLMQQLQPIRGNVLRKTERFVASIINSAASVHIINTLVQGDQNVANQITKIGDGNVFHGNVVTAQHIQGSFNTIEKSKVDDELRELLKQLTNSVTAMCNKLPPEDGERAARDLETLVTEAVSPQPRKKWYELSAQGLLDAAKSVGEIAAPVIATIKAISTVLGYPLP